MINKLIRYFKRIFKWIAIGKYHITTFLVVMVTLLFLFDILKECSQFISYFFIIIGLFIILMLQLIDANLYATYKPNTIGNWLKSFPKLKPTIHNITSSISVTISAKAFATISISESQPLEKKVEFLLSQLENVNKNLHELDTRIERAFNEILNKSKDLTIQFENIEQTLRTTIAGHIVGSYDINLLGIIITLCGTLIQIFKSQAP
ncbi:MAG: hypothetical protein HYS24_01895 [Ignavibacteriales bacterium]|nr:hypothetical protein [Ignavibacteriales bacterium]